MSEKKGRLFIISAPSGGGKGTIINKLLEIRPELQYSISATTRAPRQGEIDGKNYYFIDKERFEELISLDAFLEYAQYAGEYYGTPRAPIDFCIDNGVDALLEIEVQGAAIVMKELPEAVSIFIVPPSLEILEKRLRGRKTETEEKIAARLRAAKDELLEKDKYNHIVINDLVDRAAEEILQIIDKVQR